MIALSCRVIATLLLWVALLGPRSFDGAMLVGLACYAHLLARDFEDRAKP